MIGALQQLVGGHDAGQIQTGDGGTGRHGAGGHQDVVGGIGVLIALGIRHHHGVGGGDPGGAVEQGHLGALQQALHAGGQGLGDVALIGEDLADVGADILGVDADGGAVLGAVIHLGGVEQGLGGHTAPVQTGAAGLAVFHHGGLQTQLGGPEGGGVAAGTGADDDELIVVHSILHSAAWCGRKGVIPDAAPEITELF